MANFEKLIRDLTAYMSKNLTEEDGTLTKDSAKINAVEKVIIKYIDDNPGIETYKDSTYGLSLGMWAAMYGLEDVVLKALEAKKSTFQTTDYQGYGGYNLGMFAAKHGMLRATLKALEDTDASIQQNDIGQNIGMIAADAKMEIAVIKASKNLYAATQQDRLGQNIGMYAVQNKLTKAACESLNNSVAAVQQDINGDTIGIMAARLGLENVVDKVFGDSIAVRQFNKKGENIVLMCAESGNIRALMRAFDDKELITEFQQAFSKSKYEFVEELLMRGNDDVREAVVNRLIKDYPSLLDGNVILTIARTCPENTIIDVIKSVPRARMHQDRMTGDNIGMITAKRGFEKATLFACKSKTAVKQKDKGGMTILDYAKQRKLKSVIQFLQSNNNVM